MKDIIESQKPFFHQYLGEVMQAVKEIPVAFPPIITSMVNGCSSIIKHEANGNTQYLIFGPIDTGGLMEVLIEKEGNTGVMYNVSTEKSHGRFSELLIETFKKDDANNEELCGYEEYEDALFFEDFVAMFILKKLAERSEGSDQSSSKTLS